MSLLPRATLYSESEQLLLSHLFQFVSPKTSAKYRLFYLKWDQFHKANFGDLVEFFTVPFVFMKFHKVFKKIFLLGA